MPEELPFPMGSFLETWASYSTVKARIHISIYHPARPPRRPPSARQVGWDGDAVPGGPARAFCWRWRSSKPGRATPRSASLECALRYAG